jgi:molybdopterin-guanine dinucleotide biosynthesis protein A
MTAVRGLVSSVLIMSRDVHRPVAAAILAGGLARRLGGVNKADLRIGGRRIVERQLEVLGHAAEPVFIVSGNHRAFDDLGCRVIPDLVEGAGALGGIYTALSSSPHDRTIIVACDMPYLLPALIDLLARPSDADVVIPRSQTGLQPLCAAWSARALAPVRQRVHDKKLKVLSVLEELRVEEIGPEVLASCDPHGLLFVNVNTPHDYERAQGFSRLESKPSQDHTIDVSEHF